VSGGRPTKVEEIDRYLESMGLTRDDIEAVGDVTLDGMKAALMQQLSQQIPSLKGIALTQALKTVEALARAEPESEKEQPPLIADVVSGVVALPDERKREILAGELARLDVERKAIEEALSHA
jgi:hypothetical protein